jgi:hypothetical protein
MRAMIVKYIRRVKGERMVLLESKDVFDFRLSLILLLCGGRLSQHGRAKNDLLEATKAGYFLFTMSNKIG